MYNRTLVISDIHGCLDEFIALLELAAYKPKQDKLILLGDYVSRGPSSKAVVEKVMELVNENGAIALQGNHDHRFVRVMEGSATEKETHIFFEKGGYETLASYCPNLMINEQNLFEIRNEMSKYADHLHFIKSLPYYYEDEQYIYVHAGIKPNGLLLHEQSIQNLLYIKKDFYLNRTGLDKIVIFGHTITQDLHGKASIWDDGDKIGIDGGCAFGYQLNCLELKLPDNVISNSYYVPASFRI